MATYAHSLMHRYLLTDPHHPVLPCDPSIPPTRLLPRPPQSLKVLLHAKGEPVNLPYTNVHGQPYSRQYAWQLLAGLSQYDKKSTSYLPIRTMRLQVCRCAVADTITLKHILTPAVLPHHRDNQSSSL